MVMGQGSDEHPRESGAAMRHRTEAHAWKGNAAVVYGTKALAWDGRTDIGRKYSYGTPGTPKTSVYGDGGRGSDGGEES